MYLGKMSNLNDLWLKNKVKNYGICHLLIREFCMMELPYKRVDLSISEIVPYKQALLVEFLLDLKEIRVFNLQLIFFVFVKQFLSECSVEQVFSQFGNIIGQRRTLLSPLMLHATYMVKSCAREEYMKRIKFNSTNE
ncbi:Hypothetical_protein [Hexamita inflata]|uniref:Hypothetical_protein n=1 Tax=Hexamita inflata TaxID=28002 RepID=A0AA86N8C8_9EUKA|nr:Hypothetical protein HINF_LOCUS2452 [Hexamita inflata]